MGNYINGNDMLGSSAILRKSKLVREEFDPTNKDHTDSLKNFLTTGNWGKVQFYAEAPYVTVPETVFRKMALHAVSKL